MCSKPNSQSPQWCLLISIARNAAILTSACCHVFLRKHILNYYTTLICVVLGNLDYKHPSIPWGHDAKCQWVAGTEPSTCHDATYFHVAASWWKCTTLEGGLLSGLNVMQYITYYHIVVIRTSSGRSWRTWLHFPFSIQTQNTTGTDYVTRSMLCGATPT
jgi:hypothetical protein